MKNILILLLILSQPLHAADNCGVEALNTEVQRREKLAHEAEKPKGLFSRFTQTAKAIFSSKKPGIEYSARKAEIEAGHASAKRTLTGDWPDFNDEFVKKTTENMISEKGGEKKRYLDAKLRGDKHIDFLEAMGFGFFPSRDEILVPDILTFAKKYNAWADGLIAAGKVAASDVLRPARIYERGGEGFRPARGQLNDAAFMKGVAQDGLFPIGEGEQLNSHVSFGMHDLAHFSAFYEDPNFMKAFRQGYKGLAERGVLDPNGPEANRLYHAAENLSLVRPTDLPKFDLDLPVVAPDQVLSAGQVEKYLNEKYSGPGGQKQLASRLQRLVEQLPDAAQHIGGASRDFFTAQTLIAAKGPSSYTYYSLLGMVHESATLKGGLAASVARLEVAIAESAKITPAEWMREVSKPELDPNSRVYRFITESGLFDKDSQFYKDHVAKAKPFAARMHAPTREISNDSGFERHPQTIPDLQVSHPIDPETAEVDSFVADMQGKFTIQSLTHSANPAAVENHQILTYLEPTPEVERVLRSDQRRAAWVSRQRERGTHAFRLSRDDVSDWAKSAPHAGDVFFDRDRKATYKIISRRGDHSKVEIIHAGSVIEGEISNSQLQSTEVTQLGPRTRLETIDYSIKTEAKNIDGRIAAESRAMHELMFLNRLGRGHPERAAANARLHKTIRELNAAQAKVLANHGLYAVEADPVAGTPYKILKIDLSKSDPEHWMVKFEKESGVAPNFIFDPATFLGSPGVGVAYFQNDTDFVAVPWGEATDTAPSQTMVHEVHHWAVDRGLGGKHLPEKFVIRPGGDPKWKNTPNEIYLRYYGIDEVTARAAEAEAALMKVVRLTAARQNYALLKRRGKLDPASKIRFESLPNFIDMGYRATISDAKQIAEHALPIIDQLMTRLIEGKATIRISANAGQVTFSDGGHPPVMRTIDYNPNSQRVELSEAGAAKEGISALEYQKLKQIFPDRRELALYLQAAHNKKVITEKIDFLTSLSQIKVQQLVNSLNAERKAAGRAVGSISAGYVRGLKDAVAVEPATTDTGKLILLSDGLRQPSDVPAAPVSGDAYSGDAEPPTLSRPPRQNPGAGH
jgi:hypothetical protein